MTIDEAIALLKDLVKDDVADCNVDAAEAEGLGIEALKQVRTLRATRGKYWSPKLPGETKEV